MTTKAKKSHQYSPLRRTLELALVAGALTVAGIGIYHTAHLAKAPVPASDARLTAQTRLAAPKSSVPATAVVASPVTALNIPALGFKMVIPSGLSGITYSLQLNQPGNVDGEEYMGSTVSFSTTSLAATAECTAENGPIGDFEEFPFNPVGKVTGIAAAKRVGTNYLAFIHPEATCSSEPSVASLETSLIPLLQQAFGTVKPI
jgi:hypothetical protein